MITEEADSSTAFQGASTTPAEQTTTTGKSTTSAGESTAVSFEQVRPEEERVHTPPTPFDVIKVSDDGRCLFRSLAVDMDNQLQTTTRDEHGRVLQPMQEAMERIAADGLRSNVVSYMYNHISDYAHLNVESVNADLPEWLHYDSLQDRILSMAEPTTLPGELEVIAATKVIRKRIAVMDTQGHLLRRYGESSYSQELTVKFTSCGQDIGHYNCLIQRPAEARRPPRLTSPANPG